MDITVIIGVRPHYIKACGLWEVLKDTEIINLKFLDVHQHYDKCLRDIYLNEGNLKIETVSKVHTSSKMPIENFVNQISDVGRWLTSVKGKSSKAIIVFGDANPAFASSIAANRLSIPIIHLEAGVRRINSEKEHWNSLATDHLSSLRFCYTQNDLQSLCNEGLSKNTYFVGDILSEWTVQQASKSKSLFHGQDYCLVSIHRPQNCTLKAIECICSVLSEINEKIVWILHPRTVKYKDIIKRRTNAEVLQSQCHSIALGLIKSASLIVTDSGGFVREGVLLDRNVVVCHEQGMWEELVVNNAVARADITKESLCKAIHLCFAHQLESGKNYFMVQNGTTRFKNTLVSFIRSI